MGKLEFIKNEEHSSQLIGGLSVGDIITNANDTPFMIICFNKDLTSVLDSAGDVKNITNDSLVTRVGRVKKIIYE